MTGLLQNRFRSSLDREFVRKTITVRPEPVSSLDNVEPVIGAEILFETLNRIFLPNPFSLQFIHEMANRAFMHHCLVFSSEVEHRSRIYTPPKLEVFPICLTGLAGVGKSRTIEALRKVMPPPSELHSAYFDGVLELESYWYASAEGKASGKSLLADFLFAGPERQSGNFNKLMLECQRRANRDLVTLLLLDETQHINLGLGTAKIATILLALRGIGPPSVYVANYSLVHKLFKRNNEDKQRLLAEPRIMLPDEYNSKEWNAYVAECLRVSGDHIRTRGSDFAAELYRCTLGIKRLAVLLLKQAYLEARNAGRKWIELQDLSRAYCSTAFTVNARDVQNLNKLALGDRKVKKSNPDLWCPFELPLANQSNVKQFVNGERDKRVADIVFDSALNEVERAEIKHIVQAEDRRPIKRPRQTPAMTLSESDEAKAVNDYIDKLGKLAKPRKC